MFVRGRKGDVTLVRSFVPVHRIADLAEAMNERAVLHPNTTELVDIAKAVGSSVLTVYTTYGMISRLHHWGVRQMGLYHPSNVDDPKLVDTTEWSHGEPVHSICIMRDHYTIYADAEGYIWHNHFIRMRDEVVFIEFMKDRFHRPRTWDLMEIQRIFDGTGITPGDVAELLVRVAEEFMCRPTKKVKLEVHPGDLVLYLVGTPENEIGMRRVIVEMHHMGAVSSISCSEINLRCAACHSLAFDLCKRCRRARYCNQICAKRHYLNHKKDCLFNSLHQQ
jgi:hypothetical protein